MLNKIEIIEEYREELAAPLAKMFNSWDELWPGGFGGGVPYTTERVHKWLGPIKAIAVLIAIDQGRPIGFLTLLSHWRDPDTAYVGIFGVSPDVVGQKVGKRLLLRSIAIAAQRDFRRVDLYTWAGNLSAVPLYKKAGFMWNPDVSGVCFQSYIPAILSHPLCALFFKAHPDWYSLQQRELTQAPDEMKEKGMDLFIYRFAAGDDSLRVVVDRYARAITGVERVINGERLQIDACVAEHLTLCGLPATYTLAIENGTSEEIALSVSLQGFSGLEFDGKIDPVVHAPAGQSARLTAPFHLDGSALLYRKELKSPAITATLKTNTQEFSLATGLKIKPAAEVHTRFGECRILPGGRTPLPVTVTSNAATMLCGKLRFDLADLPITVSPAEIAIEIAPEGLAGVVVEVVAPAADLAPGTYDLWASLQFEAGSNGGVALTTRRFRIPVFCIPAGAVAVGEDDRKREVLVVSADYTARLSREGGEVEIAVPGASYPTISLETEIGPPFGLDPFESAEREVDVERSASATTISLSATHPERPLRVETRLIFPHNSPVICQQTWITNQGVEDQTFQLRVGGYSGGVALTPGRAILPLAAGVVHDRIASHLSDHPSIPDVPTTFSEGWVAVEGRSGATGQVWDPENLEEIQVNCGRITRLGYQSITLRPNEERRLSQIWHLTQTTDWKAVRRLWQEKIARRIPLQHESTAVPATVPILRISPRRSSFHIADRQRASLRSAIRQQRRSPARSPWKRLPAGRLPSTA